MIIAWMALFCLIGLAIGIVTGILPGVHVNVTATLAAAASVGLVAAGVPMLAVAGFIVTLSVTHAFFDIIPTVFLGIPADESYALLPSQRLVVRGQGLEAVYHALHGTTGGLVGACSVVLGLLALGLGLKGLSEMLGPVMGYILLAASIALVLTDTHRGWALAVFLSSGLLGLIVFGTPLVSQGGAFTALLPALGGLFGVSGLVLALMAADAGLGPQQDVARPPIDLVSVVGGTTGGLVSGFLPGLGAANVATLFRFRGGDSRYLQAVAAINASEHLVSIAALVFIGKPRSGAALAIKDAMGAADTVLDPLGLAALCVVALVTALACRTAVVRAAPALVAGICALPQRALNWGVLTFMIALVGLTTGPWGLVILVAATFLGLVAPLAKVRRAHAMGLFLVPTTLFFLGLEADVVSALGLGKITLPPTTDSPWSTLAALLGALGVASAAFFASSGLRWRGVALGVALMAASAAVYAIPPVVGQAQRFSATVVRVKDGDTLRVRCPGREIDVRLVDIDAPEKRQPYGKAARKRVEELVGSGEVTVRAVGRDKYRRLLAYVDLPDGRVLNVVLVEEGWAWRFDRYCQSPELLRLQEAAKAARRGLWADPAPVPPWEFRHPTRPPLPSGFESASPVPAALGSGEVTDR